ncbi:MAG: CbiQ family ECF transporter T component [Desulfovibrionaceae bacterium]
MARRTEKSLVAAMDPRIKLGLALALGFCSWRLTPAGLALALALVGLAWLGVGRSRRVAFPLGRTYLLFVLFWTLAQCAFALIGGAPFEDAAVRSLLFGVRLLTLVFTGLVLAAGTSTRALGLAAAWAARPVLGRRAWKLALGLALVVHFLPMSLQTLRTARASVRRRLGRKAGWRGMLLAVRAALRQLGEQSWRQTLALACRGLDQPEAWEGGFERGPGGVPKGAVLGLVAAAVIALALVV